MFIGQLQCVKLQAMRWPAQVRNWPVAACPESGSFSTAGLSRDDQHFVADMDDVEQLGGERLRYADAPVAGEPVTDVAAMDRNPVIPEPQRIGHRRIVVGRRAVILELGQNRE